MRWQGLLLVPLAVVGCTKSNPAKSCSDGTCTDPAYPFCDVSGAIAGEAGACIATSCTADAFVECRGDVEVRCNVDGSNYNLTQCERGCDDTLGGCRLCNPGETACTNGVVASCDASGVPTTVESCPLGCFGSEPRCTEIDPSNDLAMYFDMVADPPSLNIENGSFNVDTGAVFDLGQPLTVPSFAVAAPANGVALRVFVVDSLSITQASVSGGTAPSTALVILARGNIEITGKLSGRKAGSSEGLSACDAGPGVGNTGVCRSACACSASASGGGGFATNGAKGGNLSSYVGGAGGTANGNKQLVPLRGGCPGGLAYKNGIASTDTTSYGGGAIQLVSRGKILIDGIIDVRGAPGDTRRVSYEGDDLGGPRGSAMASGGAGGAILLEAPSIELGPNGSLDARGGAGGQCTNTVRCSMGGQGATPGVAATPGTDLTQTCDPINDVGAFVPGGGGGGLGRIRINTKDGTYVKSSTAAELGDLSAAPIETR